MKGERGKKAQDQDKLTVVITFESNSRSHSPVPNFHLILLLFLLSRNIHPLGPTLG